MDNYKYSCTPKLFSGLMVMIAGILNFFIHWIRNFPCIIINLWYGINKETKFVL